MVGSIDTICRRIGARVTLVLGWFTVSPATAGTPIELRQAMMTRLAKEVGPRYFSAIRQVAAA